LRANESTKNCFAFGDKHHVSIDNEDITMENLKEIIERLGHKNVSVREIEPTIEDCFMQLSQG